MAAVSPYDAGTRHLHLLLALLGIAALISGQFAGDYRRAVHTGFDIHRWIGLGMAAAVFLRLLWGFMGPQAARFAQWVPLTWHRLAVVFQDLKSLLTLRLPVREEHEGLAGLIQAIGLAAFAWMAASGSLMFAYLEPGARATGWLHTVRELHEGGEPVVIAYVAIHVGAVLLHSLAGHPVWRRMLP